MPDRISGPPVLPSRRITDFGGRDLPSPAPADATRVPGAADEFVTLPRLFPTSADGTPVFKQNDPDWGAVKLHKNETIGSAGCALTATAMVLSKISGERITPRELDAYLDGKKGYSADSLDWKKAADARGLTSRREYLTLARLDAQLDAGRPALVGVDYKPGSGGGANGTDHWVAVTGKEVDARGKVTYLANDPGTGEQIRLTPDRRGRLTGDGTHMLGKYKSSAQLQVFEPA